MQPLWQLWYTKFYPHHSRNRNRKVSWIKLPFFWRFSHPLVKFSGHFFISMTGARSTSYTVFPLLLKFTVTAGWLVVISKLKNSECFLNIQKRECLKWLKIQKTFIVSNWSANQFVWDLFARLDLMSQYSKMWMLEMIKDTKKTFIVQTNWCRICLQD